MKNDEKRFPQQEAPEKNTDDAFVRVGRNGEPEIGEKGPVKAEEKLEERERDEVRK